MKRILLILCVLSVFSIDICSAQDIIVKKDGTTIKSKVVEVGTTEIKYKKYTNVNGSTYTILKSELLSINYENGTSDNLSSTNPQNENSVIVIETGKDKTSFMHQQEIEDCYKKARVLKTWSWIITGVGILSFGSTIAIMATAKDGDDYTGGPLTFPFFGSMAFGAIYIGAGFPMRSVANNKIELAHRMSQVSIPTQDFKIGNTTVTPMLSMFKDRVNNNRSYGLSCNINF